MKPLTVSKHLKLMTEVVVDGEPLYHARYNDGEAAAMGLVPAGDANCDGHRYFPDLGSEMLRCFRSILQDRSGKVLLGTVAVTDPPHPTAKALQAEIDACGNPDLRLTVGEFWCQEERPDGIDEVLELMSVLRGSERCVLVCNHVVSQVAPCLGARPVVVSAVDAWLDGGAPGRIAAAAEGLDHPVFVWCCGFPGKVWSWRLSETRVSTHLDFGHTFDGLVGPPTREWMKRDTPMSRCYYSLFAEQVRRFL